MEDQQPVSDVKPKEQKESLQEIPLKSLAENVIKDYEKLLYDSKVINGSLKDILDKNCRPFKRTIYWVYMTVHVVHITRFCFIDFLYLKDKETRLFWQYYLVDYFEQLGMFGRCLNFCYLVFPVAFVLDKLVLHVFERNGRVDFLTNFLTLIPEEKVEDEKNETDQDIQPMEQIAGPSHRRDGIAVEMDVMTEQDKRQLLIRIKNYVKMCRVLCRITVHSTHCYDYISLPLFIYYMNPSVPVTVMAVVNMFLLMYAEHTTITYCITIYTSFLITIEYFKTRIKFLMSKAKDIKVRFEEQAVC